MLKKIIFITAFIFSFNGAFCQSKLYNYNPDTLIENHVYSVEDSSHNAEKTIYVIKYAENVFSLAKQISVIHANKPFKYSRKLKTFTWSSLSTPMYFYTEYAVKLKYKKINNFYFVEIYFFSLSSSTKKIVHQVFPGDLPRTQFYQIAVNKSLL